MAKLRKWCAYRTIERPYTRWSKVRKKAFVKSRPGKKIIKYDMGDLKGGKTHYTLCLKMISKDLTNVRANALEAARIATLKRLEANLGRTGFYFKILVVPHHVIRENPLAAGAGADRLSTGMKHAFGKTIGTAAKVEAGKTIFEVYLPKENEAMARQALNVASKKLPLRVTIQATYQKAKEFTEEEILEHKLEEAKFEYKNAIAELEIAKQKLAKASTDEEKSHAEEAIKNAEHRIESTKHIVELEEEHLHEYEEEHAHDEEEKKE